MELDTSGRDGVVHWGISSGENPHQSAVMGLRRRGGGWRGGVARFLSKIGPRGADYNFWQLGKQIFGRRQYIHRNRGELAMNC